MGVGGVGVSGLDIEAGTLQLCFISKAEALMAKAALPVFFWVVTSVCLSATVPPLRPAVLSPPPLDSVQRGEKRKKQAGCALTLGRLIAGDVQCTASALTAA